MLNFKKSKLSTFSFFLLFACIINTQIQAQCHIDDWTALKAIYENTNGDNWTNNTGWEILKSNTPTANCDLSTLNGIELDEIGRVSILKLENNNLDGEMPSEFSKLTNLAFLLLNKNYLTGGIPPEIGQLSNLTFLHMGNNNLSGYIPLEFGQLSKLTNLYLMDNKLSENIPSELGNLTNLTTLCLYSNQLSGSIPNEFGNLSSLKYLDLENNKLNGCYGEQLAILCDQLSYDLISEGNNFKASWGNFCRVGVDDCSVLKCNMEDWTALKALYESTDGDNWNINKTWDVVKTDIPPTDCSLENLEGVFLNENGRVDELHLSYFNLIGNIPAELENLNNLRKLDLSSNQLSGSIPAELANLSNLRELSLSENQLSDCFNENLAVLCSQLEYEDISRSNNFKATWENFCIGGIEACNNCHIDDWTALKALYDSTGGDSWTDNTGWEMIGNQITPPLNCTLNNLHGIKLGPDGRVNSIRLHSYETIGDNTEINSNNLKGTIPAEIGKLSELRELYLDNNYLTGNIPPEIGNLTNLEELDLSSNYLENNIPLELVNIKTLKGVNLAGNRLRGSLAFLQNTVSDSLWSSIANNYFSCMDIQPVFNEDNFSYAPQKFLPLNYDSVDVNILDTINQKLNLAIEFPFDTAGFTLQWFHNGVAMPSNNKATLNFEAIQPENSGKYTLHLSNENCLPNGNRFETISEPIYVILKGYDLFGQPVEYDQIMVEFDTEEDTERYKEEILDRNGGIEEKKCNCKRELYLWQFPNTEAATKALIDIDRKWKRTKKKSKVKGGFNNLLKIEETQDSSLAYNVISETLHLNYPDSVTVYILDSGLDDQSLDAADTLFTVNCAPIDTCDDDDELECQIGYSYVDSTVLPIPVSNTYQDELWHGTYGFHTITDSLNENHHLKVIPLKIFDKSGTGNLFDMTCALYHAINQNADVINISAGYQGQSSPILETAINKAREEGIFITAAAGNDSLNIDTLAQYPAFYAGQYHTYKAVDTNGNFLLDSLGNIKLDSVRYDNVISIASVNKNDSTSSFSNVGKQSVTLAAYGEEIHSYGLGGDDIVATGTSMSTYFVTKELALEIALNKSRNYQQIWTDFEQNRLVENNALKEITRTGKQLKVKLEVASIPGCTNPAACNYYEYATIDDGSCAFESCIDCHLSDWFALKALYQSTNGNNWKRNDGWEMFTQNNIPVTCNFSKLHGVWINDEGRVHRINLYNNNLNGTIPAEIEGLTQLSQLYLAANNLIGEIPVELSKLDKITDLILSANYLSGHIPLEMAELNELKRLNLSYNQLSGEVPPQLGKLYHLKYLKLNNNKLLGNIPKELAQLKNLYLLNVCSNLLSGCYENSLEQLCNQKWSPLFKANANISDGNSFNSSWENFCTTKEGACESTNRLNNKPKMFSLYPNPSEGKLFLQFFTSENKNNTLKISNLEGKCVLKIEGKHLIDNTFEIDLADLPKGMYILELQNAFKNYAEKFILK